MRVAHTAIVTPHRAGLYESVRDLVAAERSLGADAFIVDPQAVTLDRGVPVGLGTGIETADIVINHSGLGEHERNWDGRPIIHCLHGRPESSFRLESNGKVGVYSFVKATAANPNYRHWVTFWPRYVPYWSLLIPADRLRVLTPPVDLATWSPEGPSGYKFAGRRGEINVVCTDLWREDVTPYHAIHGFCEFAKTHPGAKLHLYGIQRTKALDVLLGAIQERGWLGEAAGMVSGLQNVFRAATMAISAHRIATRSIREAMACGCPVVSPFTSCGACVDEPTIFAKRMEMVIGADRAGVRLAAEEQFDSRKTATEMLALVDEVMQCRK